MTAENLFAARRISGNDFMSAAQRANLGADTEADDSVGHAEDEEDFPGHGSQFETPTDWTKCCEMKENEADEVKDSESQNNAPEITFHIGASGHLAGRDSNMGANGAYAEGRCFPFWEQAVGEIFAGRFEPSREIENAMQSFHRMSASLNSRLRKNQNPKTKYTKAVMVLRISRSVWIGAPVSVAR